MPEWQIEDGEWRRGKSRWAYQGGNGANRRRRMGSAASPGRQTSAQFACRLSLSCALRLNISGTNESKKRRACEQDGVCSHARRFFAPSPLRQVHQVLRRIAFAFGAEPRRCQRHQTERERNYEIVKLTARGLIEMRKQHHSDLRGHWRGVELQDSSRT